MQLYIYIYICICIYICVSLYIYIYADACVYTQMFFVYMHEWWWMYICMYMYICICIYIIYIYAIPPKIDLYVLWMLARWIHYGPVSAAFGHVLFLWTLDMFDMFCLWYGIAIEKLVKTAMAEAHHQIIINTMFSWWS